MAVSLKGAKAALREEIKQKLSKLSTADRESQSSIITNKLLGTPEYKRSKRLSVFLSMPDEVQTHQILKHLFSTGRDCFIPHYSGPTMKMVKLRSWHDYESLPENKWKIKQPTDDDVRQDALELGGLDVILMPGLGFSREGARLGRGKGYYDTYLKKCEENGLKPTTIGLAFREQIYDYIPVVAGIDVLVDMVIFPELNEILETTI